MERTEWLKARKRGIGGSDAAAVMGFSPWKTPVDVWVDKTSPETSEDTESLALTIGSALEDVVARIYSQKTGREVRRYNAMIENEFLIGNVDRLVVREGEKIASLKNEIRTNVILECKTSLDYSWEEVPPYYAAQVQHYMGLIPQIERADVAVIFKPCNGFGIYPVERSQEDIDAMQEYLRFWWKKYVEGGEHPTPESELDCRKIWAHSRGVPLTGSPDALESAEGLKKAREAIAQMKLREDALKDALASFMQDCDTLLDESGAVVLTYKSTKDRSVTDTDALIQDLVKQAGLSEEEFEVLKGKYTQTKAGSRPFTFPRKGKKS